LKVTEINQWLVSLVSDLAHLPERSRTDFKKEIRNRKEESEKGKSKTEERLKKSSSGTVSISAAGASRLNCFFFYYKGAF
jgi:hypothetical protein